MTSEAVVFLNGEFLAASQAKISVLDRGFVFGDGVYEVIPVYGARLFRLSQHLKRLDDSLIAIRIAPPLSHDRWRAVLTELVRDNGGGDLSIYLQITRGVAPRDHAFPKGVEPTVFAMANPLKPVPSDTLVQGIAAITLADTRWQLCNVKAITLLANVLARQQALDVGAAEAILLRDGIANEGAASNLFIVKDRTLYTPPKSAQLLPGVTRDLILELAAANQIPYREMSIDEDALRSADEVWLTSSTKEILPVTQLDGKKVGTGQPGPLWARMLALYQEYKQRVREHGEP